MSTPLRRHTKMLAFQLDRKVLSLEEEDHIRMDLPAQGRLKLLQPKKNKPYVLRWGASTLAVFMALFAITNGPSYVQLLQASVSDVSRKPSFEPVVLSEDSNPLPSQEIPNLALVPVPTQSRIEIASLGISAPMIEVNGGVQALKGEDWNTLEESIHESLQKGVVHYPGTALPGKRGNVFLTGHSSNVFWESSEYNTVFAKLPKIKVGDEVLIAYDQQVYRYQITETKEVKPNDVSVLEQGQNYEITLMTCTPVGTRLRRFIAKGVLVKDSTTVD